MWIQSAFWIENSFLSTVEFFFWRTEVIWLGQFYLMIRPNEFYLKFAQTGEKMYFNFLVRSVFYLLLSSAPFVLLWQYGWLMSALVTLISLFTLGKYIFTKSNTVTIRKLLSWKRKKTFHHLLNKYFAENKSNYNLSGISVLFVCSITIQTTLLYSFRTMWVRQEFTFHSIVINKIIQKILNIWIAQRLHLLDVICPNHLGKMEEQNTTLYFGIK